MKNRTVITFMAVVLLIQWCVPSLGYAGPAQARLCLGSFISTNSTVTDQARLDRIQALHSIRDEKILTARADELGIDIRPMKNIRAYGEPFLEYYYIGHDMAIKEQVNPDDTPGLIGIYGAAGCDITNFLLSTNVQTAYFVDHASVKSATLRERLDKWSAVEQGALATDYITNKQDGGFISAPIAGIKDMERGICIELKALGVARYKADGTDNIIVTDNADGTVTISFAWAYRDRPERQYSITYVTADVTRMNEHPVIASVLKDKIDIYYQRAGIEIALNYLDFMPFLARSIKPGGYLITDDYYHTNDSKTAESKVKKASLDVVLRAFEDVQYSGPLASAEMKLFERLWQPAAGNHKADRLYPCYGVDLAVRRRMDGCERSLQGQFQDRITVSSGARLAIGPDPSWHQDDRDFYQIKRERMNSAGRGTEEIPLRAA